MWLIPLLVIGAIVIAATRRSARESSPPSRLALPPPPGPISVLGEFARRGQVPPPPVILCAIAEAEAIGRCDLASDIVRAFVAPVVYQHQLANARPAHAVYERGSCALPRSSRAAMEARSTPIAPSAMPIAPPVLRRAGIPSTDEEIRAMMNVDPQGFIAMATREAPVIEMPVEAVHIKRTAGGPPAIEMPAEAVRQAAQAMQAMQPPSQEPSMGLPAETVAQMQDAHGLHEAADQTRAMAPGSPLASVSDGAWREFVMRLERESPLFSSSRHIGQYRQRRDRLAELGIDSNAVHGSARAQRAALDHDLVDAHHHAAEGGLLAEHLGRPIVIPGQERSETLTLSGLLGVIQCAGLEGVVGWLERPSDRKRYPHTTQAFLHTNGVF